MAIYSYRHKFDQIENTINEIPPLWHREVQEYRTEKIVYEYLGLQSRCNFICVYLYETCQESRESIVAIIA